MFNGVIVLIEVAHWPRNTEKKKKKKKKKKEGRKVLRSESS
jgi:hypothetical protein